MPSRKNRTIRSKIIRNTAISPVDALHLPLPPVPPARNAQSAIPPLPPLLEPLLRVGKERLILIVQHDDRPTFMAALIEPDS